ncbi:FtsX-like permease family protein [Enterococcus casseliflavus]|nr:FtsX-like permease family protein [Enterococcus casseliflavus]
MNFLKRTMKSIVSLKKRTLIIGSIFLVVSTFLITARLTQSNLENSLSNVQEELTPIVNIQLNHEMLFKEMSSGTSNANKDVLNEELVNRITQSTYVKNISVSASASLFTQYSDRTPEKNDRIPGGVISPTNEIDIYDKDSSELSKYNLKLIDGELPKESDQIPIIVSKKYAEKNNLKVGDPLELDFSSGYEEDSEKYQKKSVITGIYELDSNNPKPYLENEENLFLSNRLVLKQIKELQFSKDFPLLAGYDKIKVELNDPMDIPKFLKEINADSSEYKPILFESSYDQYKIIQNLITNFVSILNAIQLFLIFFTLIVIGLIMILSLRERKYEMGLLLSLGESKIKVILQMFLEVALILITTFIIGLGLSTVVISPQTDKMINQQIQTSLSETNTENESMMEKGPNYVEDTSTQLTSEMSINNINAKETVIPTIYLFLLLLLITSFSTILPTLKIMRKSPKEILSDSE